MDTVRPLIGWYGKSPSTGDFISRRLARGTIDKLDTWLQSGMMAIGEQAPDRWQRLYAAAPIWNALLPCGILAPDACLTVLAASFDRVGRHFPFCMVVALPAGEMTLATITSLPDYCESLSQLVEQAIRTSLSADELDERLPAATEPFLRDDESDYPDLSDITAVLGSAALGDDLTTVPLDPRAAFPWPDLARTFDPRGSTSYWWSGIPQRGTGGFTHRGSLDAPLFVTLFAEGRNGA